MMVLSNAIGHDWMRFMVRRATAARSDQKAIAQTRRKIIRQTDMPSVSLEQALRVPQAMADNYAKHPTRPIEIASALDMSPKSSRFPTLCSASAGYGLTEGGSRSDIITITSLGTRIVSPLADGDDRAAMREAVLTPTVERRFLEQYDGNPLPVEQIAKNVIEGFGIPSESADRVYEVITHNAELVGFIATIKGKAWVNLGESEQPTLSGPDELDRAETNHLIDPAAVDIAAVADIDVTQPTPLVATPNQPNRRVFISHGKAQGVVKQLKDILEFGEFEPVVAIEEETSSEPVPKKVMDSMRRCAAGIIHVSAEERLLDPQGNERRILNQNVLIEIGAAMALYGDRFILLVEDGATLPSNLQGLYQVRYTGTELDYDSTMKVLKAARAFKASD